MDRLDKILLDAVQDGFPVCPSPYEAIASRCGTSADEAERRIGRMRAEGVIRRLGALVDSRALGMETTLAAADVEPEAVEKVAGRIDGFPEVTHSYLREGRPNLWFTLVATSHEAIDRILEGVGRLPGVTSVSDLPAVRVFKLRVRLDASAERGTA